MFGDDDLNVKMADVKRDLENVRGVWNFGETYRGQMAKTNHFVAFKESTGAFTLGSEWGGKRLTLKCAITQWRSNAVITKTRITKMRSHY